MRRFQVVGMLPPTLGMGGGGARKRNEHLTAKQADPNAELDFPPEWNEPDVRGVLYAAQGRVCGFCGCDLPRNDRGDVEHFRPKDSVRGEPPNGGYWWLAYEFSNYLLSCQICNRSLKRTKFPLLDETKRVSFDSRHLIDAESPLLAHPGQNPVDEMIDVDFVSGFLDARDGEQQERVAAIRNFFQWNVDARLVIERRRVIAEVNRMLERGDDDAVRVLASRYRRHSLVVVRLLEALNRIDLIPTPEEEVQMFALELIEELRLEQRQRVLQEGFWTLRALWETAGPDLRLWLQARWDEVGIREQIEGLIH